jgi:hypothetical protein
MSRAAGRGQDLTADDPGHVHRQAMAIPRAERARAKAEV